MLTFERTLPLSGLQFAGNIGQHPHSCYFDIETTGFSARMAQVYLIGFARPAGDHLQITQLFAETPEEEKNILDAFVSLLSECTDTFTYNGVGFDIPFLQGRYRRYGMSDPFSSITVVDIFKEVSRIRHLLQLPDHKQKTLEYFLGFSRNDLLSGGDLIPIYKAYAEHAEEEALSLMLLHNYEDILGLTASESIYSYRALLKHAHVSDIDIHTYTNSQQQEKIEIYFTLTGSCEVPRPVSVSLGEYHLQLDGRTAVLRVPVHQGELLYFYPDYQNYYYIPSEDRAIHKSLAAYIDKENRIRCHAYDCYTRKSGLFLPQPREFFRPQYKQTVKDKTGWFELTQEFLEDPKELHRYLCGLLEMFLDSSL